MSTDDPNDDPVEEGDAGGSARRSAEQAGRRVSDTVRKAIASGFRSVNASQEKLREIFGDAVPKEVLGYVKGAIDGGRDEIVRIIGQQTKRFIEGIDVGGEVAKILTALSFEIRTEIRFIPNDGKLKPNVKFSVKPKRADKDKDRGTGDG